MGPDWSIADSDEFEEMDNNAEEEAIENSEIYESQNLKRIFAPHSIVNGESFANKIKVRSVVSSQDLDESVHHEEECDKEYRSLEEDFAEPNEKKGVKKKEGEEKEEEEEEEEEEEDDGDESYREGQVFKSLLMLAR